MEKNRDFMKTNIELRDKYPSDQQKNLPAPPLSKEFIGNTRIDLPEISKNMVASKNLYDAIIDRKSHRKFTGQQMSLQELSYLLYATQGVKFVNESRKYSLRTVPSGGARHAFETYLYINKVERLEKGIYYYEPFEHQLVLLYEDEYLNDKVTEAALNQGFVGNGAVTFIWTCIPYRCEWRYKEGAYKLMLLDAGHICQNLYLAVESIACGTCAIAAYDQEKMDEIVKVDGKDEFVVYLAPVGKV